MDFYLALDGEKKGPYSIFKVGELLERGVATEETYAWHRGLEEWRPIRDIPALDDLRQRAQPQTDSPAEPPPLPDPVSPGPKPSSPAYPSGPLPEIGPAQVGVIDAVYEPPRPFARFWARMFDYTLISVAVFHWSGLTVPEVQAGESFNQLFARYMEDLKKPEALVFANTLFFALMGWQVLEAILVHLLGTTPGKALFGIRVKSSEGGRVPLTLSLARSFYVYVMGVGFYQFPFILIGMVFSFFRLTTTGQCLWDQHLRTKVEQTPLGAGRIVLAILAFFVLLLLQSVRFS